MTKKTKIKKFLISAISCILLVCALCMTASDALAQSPRCKGDLRCYPGCRYSKDKVETCTLCPLFVLVFNTVSKVGSLSAKNFSNSIIQVVVVFFAVWLAMEVIKFVGSMKTKDLKDFAQTLITKGFTVILVITILKTGVGNFYNIFIQPVYNTAQHMAQIMVEDTNSEGTNENYKNEEDKKEDKSIAGIKEIKNGLPSSIGASIVRTMTMMENRIRKIKALGASLICSSFQDAWIPIFPKIKYLIYGGATWVLTVAMIIVIPFLMIDAVFELGVATLLMPFAVGAYAFNYTRKHCKKVWDTFLNSACNFLFTSVVVLILLGALQSATQESMGSIDGFDKMFVMGGGGDNVYSAFKDTVEWRSPMFLNLVFIFLLAWAVMKMGKEFAGEIASSLSPTEIGSQLGGQIGKAAQGAVLKATAPTRSAVGVGVQAVNRLAGRGIARGIAKVRTGIMKSRMENNKDKQVTNADGSKSVTIRGKTYTMDKDGNITREKNKEKVRKGILGRNPKKRLVTEKEIRTDGVIIKRKIITIMEKKDDKWVEVRQRTDDRMRITRNIDIINRDGTINIKGMDKLLAGTSGDVKQAIQENINRSIQQSRFSKAAFDPENEVQPGSQKTYMDNETGEMITEYKTKKGELVVSRTKINREKGIAETRLTRIDAKGRAMVFESDGLRNKMTTMLLKKDADVENISLDQIRNIEDLCQTDQSGNVLKNVAFAYTEHSNAGESDGNSNYGKKVKDERVRRQKGEGVVEYLGRRGRERQQLWKEKKSLRQERRARRATMREDFRKNKENLKNLHNEKINEIDQDLRKNMQETKNYEEAKTKYREDRWKEWNNNRKARKELRQERRKQRREIRQDFLDRRQKSKENFLGRDKVRRNKRKLNGGWFGGNDYSLREANMNFYFTSSKSPRSLKRAIRGIFGWQ